MFCTSCGTTLSPGVAICPSCNKPAPDNVATPNMLPQPSRVLTQEQPPAMIPKQHPQRVSTPRLTVLSILLALLIIGVSGMGYYALAARPAWCQAQPTAGAQNLDAT